MNKTLRRLIAILMAVALAFAMSASVLAEEEEEEKEEEEQSSSATWTNTITNPEDGSQNVIQNVNVNVEVELENKGGSDGGSADAGTGAVQNPETLLKYCEITGSAITSHELKIVTFMPKFPHEKSIIESKLSNPIALSFHGKSSIVSRYVISI